MQNKPQLFCLTYAGGTASFYDILDNDINGVDVIKLEYAGHGRRNRESFYCDFEQLADDMFNLIKNMIIDEYAILGYSMGSIGVAEVLYRILLSDMPRPKHVFIAAHEPHTKSELMGFKDDELDEWVKKRTISFGDVPEKLLNNEVFWRMYLPMYRADYTIIGKYEFEKLKLETKIPLTVFYSEKDTPRSEMEQWKKHFINYVDYYRFEGGHFFIRDYHKEIAEIIMSKLGVNKDD